MSTPSLPSVTKKNYYDPHIQMAYMSASQFKNFRRCEAATMAALRGEYQEAKTKALLVGGYIDAHFSGEMAQFKEENPEIFSSKFPYGLKSEFKEANTIIKRMERDRLYMMLMTGKKQIIRTGFIAGVPFKIKMDVLLDAAVCREIVRQFPNTANALGMCAGAIVDQKVMADFKDIWSPEDMMKIPFVEYWGYDIQGAIYQEIEGHMLPFIINGATKAAVPDLKAFWIRDEDLAAKLAEVEDLAPRYQAIKEGKIEPTRCENCPHCIATKQLNTIVDYKEVEIYEC